MTEEKKASMHVVIIPDGNRRWAKEKNLKPWDGHEEGAKVIEKLARHAVKKGVSCLSFWGSSLDNLKKRPLEEKVALLRIYETYFKKLAEGSDVHENETKISVIGRWKEQFPSGLKKIIEQCIDKTKHYTKNRLNFFLAYGGDDEMIEAIKQIVASGVDAEKITPELIKQNLMTKDLPPVDYLIRTGGEPHLSAGFMMWDTANSQLFFSEKFFPDFKENEFDEAMREYEERERRQGK